MSSNPNVNMNNAKTNNVKTNNAKTNNAKKSFDPYQALLASAKKSVTGWVAEFSPDGPWKKREIRLRQAVAGNLPRNRAGMLRESIRQLYTEMHHRMKQVMAEYADLEMEMEDARAHLPVQSIQEITALSKVVSKQSRRILKEIVALYQSREAANQTSLYENNARASLSKWDDPPPHMPEEHRRAPIKNSFQRLGNYSRIHRARRAQNKTVKHTGKSTMSTPSFR